MNSLRKYFWVGLIAAKSNLAYFGEAIGRIFFLGVILFIFLRLWQVTYGQTHAAILGGFTLPQMLWYLVVTESIMLSTPRIAQYVDQDVRTGAIAVYLLRPMSYPLHELCVCLGERFIRFAINLMVGSVIALVCVGPIALSPSGLLLFLLAIPLAFVLDFLGYFLIGLCAFWMEDTTGLVFLYSRITMVLGGMLIPLELFPETWQPILRALPFSSIVYGPARMFVRPDLTEFVHLVIRQGLSIAVVSLIVYLVWNSCLKRVFANGG